MPKKADPIKTLEAFVAKYPTKAEAAKALNISPPYLFDLLHGNRLFTEFILDQLGLERIVTKVSE